MNKQYGFYTEEYDNGTSIDTLMTGDGRTEFLDVVFEDGQVAIGMSYGDGIGIGKIRDQNPPKLATDMGAKWQVKFECPESIDAMIDTLLRIKDKLANQ